jgi:hypothetical protein
MSDSEDDKPLIKGTSMQLPVYFVCLAILPLLDSPHFEMFSPSIVTQLSLLS